MWKQLHRYDRPIVLQGTTKYHSENHTTFIIAASSLSVSFFILVPSGFYHHLIITSSLRSKADLSTIMNSLLMDLSNEFISDSPTIYQETY